jgi:hypothetical protein
MSYSLVTTPIIADFFSFGQRSCIRPRIMTMAMSISSATFGARGTGKNAFAMSLGVMDSPVDSAALWPIIRSQYAAIWERRADDVTVKESTCEAGAARLAARIGDDAWHYRSTGAVCQIQRAHEQSSPAEKSQIKTTHPAIAS